MAAIALITVVGVAACGGHSTGRPPAGPAPTTKTGPAAARQPGPAQPPLLSALAMLSPDSGVGLFTRTVGASCQALSAATTDGGTHFGTASLITSFGCANGGPVTSIAADAAGDMFAYGPGLFVDLTGSAGWRASPQPGAVLAVSAVGRSVWLVLAGCHGASIAANGCGLRLVESADGGRTWFAAPAQPGGAVLPGNSAGPALGGAAAAQTWLVRTGPTAGYLFAPPTTNPDGKPDSAPVWFTSDGGRSWSARHAGCGLDAQYDAAAAAPGGTLAVVCASEPGAGQQLKSTATSVDGGLTWTVHTGCLLQPGCQDPLYNGYLGQIAAVSAQTMYLVGARSSLLVSTDGGAHWQPVQPLVGDDSGGSFSVVFFGPADGLVVADSTAPNGQRDVFRTEDGGRTWSRVQPRLS